MSEDNSQTPEGAEKFVTPETDSEHEIDENGITRILEEDRPLRERVVNQLLANAPGNVKELFVGMSESTERGFLRTEDLSEYQNKTKEERFEKIKGLIRTDIENLQAASKLIHGE